MKKNYRKRRRIKCLAFCLCFALFLAKAIHTWLAPKTLSSRAVYSISAANWALDGPTYQWIADHQVVYWKFPAKGNLRVPDHLWQYDGVSKKETALCDYKQLADSKNNSPGIMQVSPDGRFILWSTSAFIQITDCRANVISAWWDDYTPYFWMANSREVGKIVYTKSAERHLEIRNIANHTHRDIGLPAEGNTVLPVIDVKNIVPGHSLLFMSWVPDDLSSHHEGVRVNLPSSESSPIGGPIVGEVVEIEKVDLDPIRTLSHTYRLHAPVGTKIQDVSLSPDGTRLAWQVTSTHLLQAAVLLQHLFPRLQVRSFVEYEIWVSDLNGANMHEICRQPQEKPLPPSILTFPAPVPKRLEDAASIGWMWAADKQRFQPDNIRWLPDGKHLSLLYEDRLWILPAD